METCYISSTIKEVKRLGYNPDHFFKFSLTRNPWDRLVSWYHFITSDTRLYAFIRTHNLTNDEITDFVQHYNLTFRDYI